MNASSVSMASRIRKRLSLYVLSCVFVLAMNFFLSASLAISKSKNRFFSQWLMLMGLKLRMICR